MTQFSNPWNLSPTIGDAQTYSATEFATYFNQIAIGEGANLANRGVVNGFNNELEVLATSPTSTSVNVSTGAAFVQGIGYTNDAVVTLPIAANGSGLTRIDTIVLRTQFNNSKTVRLAVSQGTPGGGKKGLQQVAGSIWEIPLAYVTLANGFSAITQANIEDAREYVNIPSTLGVRAVNGSGGTLGMGTVVIWSGAGFTTTTTQSNPNVAGILEANTQNAGTGRIITKGIFYVLCDELVAVGDLLTTSTTAGQAQKMVGSASQPFARVLVANTGAGTWALCYVNVPINQNGTPGTRATKNAIQALGAGALTQITFSGVDYDDLSWFNNGADSIVVNAAGRYQISFYGIVSGSSNAFVSIYLNGSPVVTCGFINGGTAYWEGQLAASDAITAYINSAGGGNAQTSIFLTVRRVG